VVAELDQESLVNAIKVLASAGVESVATCLLNSYRNPAHEREVHEALNERLPNVFVTTSSDVAPIMREYERSVITVLNAYVAPKMTTYLRDLAGTLSARGLRAEPRIMRSDGGWFSAEEASRHPVRVLESGPAAGAIAAAQTALDTGAGRSVAFDMGGTTAKACLVMGGEPSITEELEISRLERFKKGSGYPVRLPSVDLIEIGAGGGSIASIGPLGLLQVGPESSGAMPGPACYGRGGDRPTVTDADLILGYLNPDWFAGGTMTLDVEAARHAVVVPAWAIHDLVNENMARAIRLHCIEHGVHPSAVSIIATGGAGPVHASGLLAKVGAQRVICPPNVGVASALGLLLAPRVDERTITHIVPLDQLSPEDIDRRLAELVQRLSKAAQWPETTEVRRLLSMRLRGQGYEVSVALPSEISSREDVAAAFRRTYAARFGRKPAEPAQIEVVDWTARLVASADVGEAKNSQGDGRGSAPTPRVAYWGPDTGGCEDSAVYERSSLTPGCSLAGPAMIEEPTSTVVVRPGQVAIVDDYLNISITAPPKVDQS